jgi:hypothetical protein
MLIDLLDKLIDRCIQLAQRREKQDRDLYSELLSPALDEFERIHKNYIDTFVAYKAMLNGKDNALTQDHPIFNKLVEDSQSSFDLRAKVMALREYTTDPILGRFIHRMCNYIMGQQIGIQVLEEGEPMRLNAPRGKFSRGLKTIFVETSDENTKRLESIALLNYVMGDLQDNYQLVMDEHVRVKAKLLGLKAPEQPISHLDAINIRFEDRILSQDLDN